MQVRSIEFQENFARVPVEGARQQSLLQREPLIAQQQAGEVLADQHVLEMSRPRPTTETEGTVVNPDSERAARRRARSDRRAGNTEEQPAEEERPGDDRIAGTKLDVVA